MTTVAVLGTGIMGEPIARNLCNGIDVRVWNRTRSKADPLADDGATVHDTASEAVSGADIVLTMLLDTDTTAETMGGAGGALEAMSKDAVWIQAGTVGVDGIARLAALAESAGVGLRRRAGARDPTPRREGPAGGARGRARAAAGPGPAGVRR